MTPAFHHQFHVITIYPDFVTAYSRTGVFRAAHDKRLATVAPIDLREFAVDKHGSVDDHPYGGGDGMVLRPEPLAAAVKSVAGAAAATSPYVVSTSPGGKPWTGAEARKLLALQRPITFACGRFAGIDQRFVDRYVDVEYSAGDFVLAGGELFALMMIESMLRYVPGVLGHGESAAQDSFEAAFDGGLEYPLYTRPPTFEGESVPPVLLSGDHAAIAAWRLKMARQRTARSRPDLLSETRKPPQR
jgi:tRNA (guanine37-N1)-methyltransferase